MILDYSEQGGKRYLVERGPRGIGGYDLFIMNKMPNNRINLKWLAWFATKQEATIKAHNLFELGK